MLIVADIGYARHFIRIGTGRQQDSSLVVKASSKSSNPFLVQNLQVMLHTTEDWIPLVRYEISVHAIQ